MKATNQCPKCQSYNIVYIKGGKYNAATSVPLNSWNTKMGALDRYICVDCGFSEEYLQPDEKIKKSLLELLDKQGGGYDDYV